MKSVLFILTRTKKVLFLEKKEIYSTIRAVDSPVNYGLVANQVFKDYAAAVELEKGCTYEIEVRHPQVVLRCET